MIYRAIAYPAISSAADTEQVVFIEAISRQDASDRLHAVLASAWGVPAEFYNLSDERELLRNAAGEPSTGDARLLETGFSRGTPTYAAPDNTHYFVSPRALRRLVAAQRFAAALATGQHLAAA
jgi:hypothetical protein